MWTMKTETREKLYKLPLIDVYVLPSHITQVNMANDAEFGPRVVVHVPGNAHLIPCDDAETAREIAKQIAETNH